MKPYTVVLVIEVQAEDAWQAAEKFYEAATDQPPVNVFVSGTPADGALDLVLEALDTESIDLSEGVDWKKD